MVTVVTFQLLVYLISKRWKFLFVYLLPVLLIASYTGMLIKIYVVQDAEEKAEWTLERHQAITMETFALAFGFFTYIIIFCPSLKFCIGIYFPIYISMHLAQMYQRFDWSNKKELNFSIMLVTALTFDGGLFFFMVQQKELRRFFDHRVTIRKE